MGVWVKGRDMELGEKAGMVGIMFKNPPWDPMWLPGGLIESTSQGYVLSCQVLCVVVEGLVETGPRRERSFLDHSQVVKREIQ